MESQIWTILLAAGIPSTIIGGIVGSMLKRMERRMDEKELLSDLEYLQQTYPGEVRRCQRRIAEILDKYDYEGSMIYDEYPDRLSLYRIADTVGKILEQESEKVSGDLIQVLVCDEIYKRRHGGRRGMIAFL